MNHTIASFFARYRLHHDMNRSFLEWVGVVGCIAFPAFYLLRFTGAVPPRYDDIGMRLVATGLCLFLALRRWWPAPIKPYYLAYSYVVVCYCLSFLLSFTAMRNGGEVFSIVNMMVGAFLTILLADWRNAICMLLLGYGLSLTAFQMMAPEAQSSLNILVWMPACLLVVVAGALSHYVQKQSEVRRMRQIYSGIAGSIAHEMGGPMQKIQQVLDTLERDLFRAGHMRSHPVSPVEQTMAMARVLQEGRNAVRLGLQSISVTLQQLNTRALDSSGFASLSAATCAERAVHEFAYENEVQRERTRFEEVADFTFKGDETVLTLILFNLLKNALYHLPSHPGARVTVTVDARHIRVRDTGPGIASGRMANLFEDFQTSGKAEGTGLGLSFCRRAMRALGGEITCASRLGEFTEFTLSFPEVSRADAAAQDEAVIKRANTLLRGCRVLVVDNDLLQRRAACANLMALGGTSCVDEASDGVQALEMLAWASLVPYDLVVTDLEMAMPDGHGLVRRMRSGAVPRHEHVPVLARSADADTGTRAKAREAGMDGFLRKSGGVPELARAIVNLLKDQPVRGAAIDLAPFAGQTALLAEDNDMNRSIVKGYLEELGISEIGRAHV